MRFGHVENLPAFPINCSAKLARFPLRGEWPDCPSTARVDRAPLPLSLSIVGGWKALGLSEHDREERGPAETLPGRKAETDRVREGISEGVRPAESVRVALRGSVSETEGIRRLSCISFFSPRTISSLWANPSSFLLLLSV